jgi:Glycosyltransferase like family 2
MSQPQAPIVLFCFNRPQHLERTLASLMACPGYEASPIFVYADGPRHDADRPLVAAVHEVLARRLPASATVVTRSANVGLSANIIEGVTAVCATYGQAIVLEDDLLLDPRFLQFVNDALRRYADVENVYQVSGFMFDAPALKGRREAVLLPWSTSWGWATWQRAWQQFDPSATGWEALERDPALRRRFNLGNTYDYASMLERQMNGQINSWAVRWYWTLFRAAALAVYPPFNLVDNTGFDGSGTHGRGWLRRFAQRADAAAPTGDILLPDAVVVDQRIHQQVLAAIWRCNGGWLGHAVSRARQAIEPWRPSARGR